MKKLLYEKFHFSFIITNIILLILNFFLLILKKEAHHNFEINLNFIDLYIIRTIQKINEENENPINIKLKNIKYGLLDYLKESLFFSKPLKKIKLDIMDTYNVEFQKKWFHNKLGDKFDFEFDSHLPDYLIFNTFGNNSDNNKYNQSIKIAFFTENFIPDLHIVDYAIAHSHINYLDRFFHYPLLLNNDFDIIDKKRREVLSRPIRQKFCAALISNSFITDKFRLKFINELNKYKTVDMGGLYNNNIGKSVKDKIAFLNSYKFSIAMENSDGDGYSSEKLIDAFKTGTIPIYYGDYMVDEFINPKSFILIKGEKDLYQKIQYIITLDNNDEKYKSILKENVISNKYLLTKLDKEMMQFFSHIFNQKKSNSIRRDNYYGLK